MNRTTPGRIDTHAHLLPGLDDGSRDVAESIEIARRMVDAGYTHLFCTPHVWPHHPDHRPGFIRHRVSELQDDLDKAGIPLKLLPGAELNLETDLYQIKLEQIPTYAMERRYALFDFWDDELPKHFWLWIERLRATGATPIVAHPERIGCFQDDPTLVDRLAREGLLFQGNLQPLTGALGRTAQRLGERLLTEGRYFMLGSDLHRIESIDERLDGLRRATELVGEAEIDRLTRTNPRKLFTDPPPA